MAMVVDRGNAGRCDSDCAVHFLELPFRRTTGTHAGGIGDECNHTAFVVHPSLHWCADLVERGEGAVDDSVLRRPELISSMNDPKVANAEASAREERERSKIMTIPMENNQCEALKIILHKLDCRGMLNKRPITRGWQPRNPAAFSMNLSVFDEIFLALAPL